MYIYICMYVCTSDLKSLSDMQTSTRVPTIARLKASVHPGVFSVWTIFLSLQTPTAWWSLLQDPEASGPSLQWHTCEMTVACCFGGWSFRVRPVGPTLILNGPEVRYPPGDHHLHVWSSLDGWRHRILEQRRRREKDRAWTRSIQGWFRF